MEAEAARDAYIHLVLAEESSRIRREARARALRDAATRLRENAEMNWNDGDVAHRELLMSARELDIMAEEAESLR